MLDEAESVQVLGRGFADTFTWDTEVFSFWTLKRKQKISEEHSVPQCATSVPTGLREAVQEGLDVPVITDI